MIAINVQTIIIIALRAFIAARCSPGPALRAREAAIAAMTSSSLDAGKEAAQ